jgi:dTDP-4-amino-4,6-dideoxygalactose transaminase
MIPLTRPTLPLLQSIQGKLKDVFKSGMITCSKYVEQFEQRCAKFLGVKYMIAVSSGTSALLAVLTCLDLKGEVILPSFTFTSDGHSLLWRNLKPVFADIDPETLNLDPSDITAKITRRTGAIMPTHVFGNPCDISAIQKIAREHKLKVIYDAAHAFGATYKNKPIAQFGDATIYSLTPTKVLTAAEGGLIATDNKKLAHKLKLFRHNGDSFKRSEEFLGLSSRLSEFHAILGLEGLRIFRQSQRRRLALVKLYKKELRNLPGISFQEIEPKGKHVYKDFTILVDSKRFGSSRDQIITKMKENNIQTKVYFDPPLHKKKVYTQYRNLSLPNTNFVSKHIMNLPLYSHMSASEVLKVCNLIKKIYGKR